MFDYGDRGRHFYAIMSGECKVEVPVNQKIVLKPHVPQKYLIKETKRIQLQLDYDVNPGHAHSRVANEKQDTLLE